MIERWSDDHFFSCNTCWKNRDKIFENLISLGTQEKPLQIDMAPGTVAGATPLYEKVWFWVLTGVAVSAIAGTSGYFIHERMQPQDGAAFIELGE